MLWDEIAARAYEKWVRRGRPPGTELQDWLEAEAELRRLQEQRRRSLVERAPVICWSVDVELMVTSCSGSGLAELGLGPKDVVGKSLFVLFESGDPEDRVIAAHRRALQGEAVTVEQDWRGRVFQVHVEPLAPGGRPGGECIAFAVDVTERRRAEDSLQRARDELQRRLQEWSAEQARTNAALQAEVRERTAAGRRLAAEHAVTHALAQSRTLADAAPRVVQAVCDSLGWALGALWLPDRGAGALRCLGPWHAAGAAVPAFEEAVQGYTFVPGAGLPGRVWVSGQPLWVADMTREAGSRRANIAAAAGLRGHLAFPVLSGSDLLGVLEFFSPEAREPDRDLLEVLGSVGCQIGQFVERRRAEQAVQEHEQELRVARKIQQGLLPRSPPALPGLDLAGLSVPAQETGGDYFDFFLLPDGAVAVAVGDASGHGVGAALLIAETRAYIRALSLTHADLATIQALTNRRFAEDVGDYYFVTLFLARYDPRSRALTYTSAGHPTAHVVDAAGSRRADLDSTGWPLGVEVRAEFPAASPLVLQPGDLLLVMTDGVLEARSPQGELFGCTRALDVARARRARPAREIVTALQEAVTDFCQGRPADDDGTCVVLKVGAD
jgi:PAS domain S-box-containing protein